MERHCENAEVVAQFLKDHPMVDWVNYATLQHLSSYPLITYDYAFTGSTIVSKVFKEANLEPNIMIQIPISLFFKRV